jgi:transposase
MVQPVTVGLDIAKNVFHAYGVDTQGEKVFSRKLRRGQVEAFFAKLAPCLIGIEACATAHHWARILKRMGHQVRLIPPAYVKPYVKTQKNDEADAKRFAKPSRAQTCGSRRSRPSSNKARSSCIVPAPC